MKKLGMLSLLSAALVLNGCASNGGLAVGKNSCDVGVTTAVGSAIGAVAGFALSNGNRNSSAQNNRAMALGALAGGAIAAYACMSINAKTVEKKSAAAVESQYKRVNGSLPAQTKLQRYSTSLAPATTVTKNDAVILKSDLSIVQGRNQPITNLKETLVLKDSKGKVLKTITKDVTESGSYGSGEFENSFTWKFPAGVSTGDYTIETDLYLNGEKVANNSKVVKLV